MDTEHNFRHVRVYISSIYLQGVARLSLGQIQQTRRFLDFFTGSARLVEDKSGAFTSDFMEIVEARLSSEGLSVERAIEYWGWDENMPPENGIKSDT